MTQSYRHISLGTSLSDSLDELIQAGRLSPALQHVVQEKIWPKFDQKANEILSKDDYAKPQIKAHVKNFRYVDNVWQFDCDQCTIKDLGPHPLSVNSIRFVCTDSKVGETTGKKTGKAAATKSS